MAADRVRDQSRRRTASHDHRPAAGLRNQPVERRAPEPEEDAVQNDEDDQNGPREGVRLGQKIDRGEREELDEERREQEAHERLPPFFLLALVK